MVSVNVNSLRSIADSIQTSRRDLDAAAQTLAAVDHPTARAARLRCVQESNDLGRVRTELIRRAEMFQRADDLQAAHVRPARIDYTPRIPSAAELIDKAKKWAKEKINAKLEKIMAMIKGKVSDLAPFGYIGAKAVRGVFWGNFAGKENRFVNGPRQRGDYDYHDDIKVKQGERTVKEVTWEKAYEEAYPGARAVDPLDLCAAKHDYRFKTLKITAATQILPSGLMKGETSNLELAHCARHKAVPAKGFDPDRRDPNSQVKGSDARDGIIALFGLLGAIGKLLNEAVDAAAGLKYISREFATEQVEKLTAAPIRRGLNEIPALKMATP
jgi:hypothetical protein